MAKKIGVYGGTFDPIHYAHLILAREALEQLQLEQIIFVPAAISPHKVAQAPAPAAARLEMLERAVAGEPQFCIDDLELQRPPPSFTIDTVEALRDPAREIFYLIGADNLPGLSTWHRIDDLKRLVQFVVLERGPATTNSGYPTIRRQIDISASEIRNRVATGRSIRYFVPPAVEEIIQQRRLYQEPTKSPQKI
ncbi:MAG: nicotinate-nucleotide adenylyltransferase [Verrucomicrobiota bacterium]|nr:nicotinate-nucleotide adenylyltransferase [Verrucomicrobiota bacterium]